MSASRGLYFNIEKTPHQHEGFQQHERTSLQDGGTPLQHEGIPLQH